MEFWLWIIIVVLIIVINGLLNKIYLMHKSAQEINTALEEILSSDTNTLITISSRDPYMRKLAADINSQLRLLRRERQRFQSGDQELKEAITNISHDLRTPLTAIFGYLELLKQEEQPDTVRRYLSIIGTRTEALKQLTEELFRYSVISSVPENTMEPMDLRQVLEKSLLSFYGAMEQKNIMPDIHIPDQRIERMLNPEAVSRIFGNIITNALKYSNGDFTVRLYENGSITFTNTAHSLTPVTAGKLFDRFYTVESGQNATGLGLSIAKTLTERMGGTIAADYRDAKLSIIVSFPLKKG